MDTGMTSSVPKMDKVLTMYSMVQIVERMYNNYYRRAFWPALVQVGIIGTVIPSALCLSMWNLVSKDPRVLLMFVTILEGSVLCILAPYCASKVNTTSRLFLKDKCTILKYNVFSDMYLRKRVSSKTTLKIKLSDNFMDSEFPLSVLMFCVNNIFSLLVIFKRSN